MKEQAICFLPSAPHSRVISLYDDIPMVIRNAAASANRAPAPVAATQHIVKKRHACQKCQPAGARTRHSSTAHLRIAHQQIEPLPRSLPDAAQLVSPRRCIRIDHNRLSTQCGNRQRNRGTIHPIRMHHHLQPDVAREPHCPLTPAPFAPVSRLPSQRTRRISRCRSAAAPFPSTPKSIGDQAERPLNSGSDRAVRVASAQSGSRLDAEEIKRKHPPVPNRAKLRIFHSQVFMLHDTLHASQKRDLFWKPSQTDFNAGRPVTIARTIRPWLHARRQRPKWENRAGRNCPQRMSPTTEAL